MSLRTYQVILGSLSTKKADNSQQCNSKSKSSSCLRTFFSLPKSPYDILKDIVIGTILAFAAVKSPLFWVGLNELAKNKNLAATPISAEFNPDKPKKPIPEEVKNFLWDKNGLNQNNVAQYKDDCQIIANIIASTFTEEGLKRLESLIEVRDFNLDKNNFYINFNVNINGKQIPVLYKDLIRNSNHFYKNDPHAPHVLSYAIEKELRENYLPNPDCFTAQSTGTFITNKNYLTQILPAMSDASLIEILKQAPEEIITVGSYPEDATSRALVGVIALGENRTPTSKIILSHKYAVKKYEYKNGQHLITIAASGTEVTLTLEDLRRNILSISAPSNTFNLFDSQTAEVYLFSLITLIALTKAIDSFQNRKRVKHSA